MKDEFNVASLGDADFDYEASYEALVEFLYLAPVGIIKFRPDGVIEMANPAAAQLLMPLATDGDMSDLFQLLSTTISDLRTYVERFESDAGQIFDQLELVVPSTRATLMLDINKIDQRTLMAVIQNVTDLTEARRQAKQETNSQRLLASVFMGINAPVVVVRTDGFILMANTAFLTLVEYDARGIVGLNIDALLPTEHGAEARAALSQQMRAGGCYQIGMQIVSKGGTRSNVLMNSALLRQGDHRQFRVITLLPHTTSESSRTEATQSNVAGSAMAQVQVISLETIKAAIGPDWPFMASRALMLTEDVLRHLVGHGDILKCGKDDSFIIWFREPEPERISMVMQRARNGIRRLFITEFGAKIAGQVNLALQLDARMGIPC